MNALISVQRPHLVRNSDVGIDEKTATFFVDKAIHAIAEDVAGDLSLARITKRHGASLGNDKGRERFVRRLAKHAGPATLTLYSTSEKKRFTLMWDFLHVSGSRIVVKRMTSFIDWRCEPSTMMHTPLMISRHALIRAVQRVEIASVDDVFAFLKAIWAGLWFLLLVVMSARFTTPGRTCWLVPVPFGERMLGLLIARPTTDDPPAMVTVYRDDWVPDALQPAVDELLRVLADDPEMGVEESVVADLLARLVV